jgi:hypothetical protein
MAAMALGDMYKEGLGDMYKEGMRFVQARTAALLSKHV